MNPERIRTLREICLEILQARKINSDHIETGMYAAMIDVSPVGLIHIKAGKVTGTQTVFGAETGGTHIAYFEEGIYSVSLDSSLNVDTEYFKPLLNKISTTLGLPSEGCIAEYKDKTLTVNMDLEPGVRLIAPACRLVSDENTLYHKMETEGKRVKITGVQRIPDGPEGEFKLPSYITISHEQGERLEGIMALHIGVSESRAKPYMDTPKSIAWAPHGYAAAIAEFEEEMQKSGYFSRGLNWTFPTTEGRRFAEQLPALNRDMKNGALEGILRTCIQIGDVDKVNQFLRNEGSAIAMGRAPPIKDMIPGYFASVIDILVTWGLEGERTNLRLRDSDKVVEAVMMEGRVTLYSSQHNPNNLIAEVKTQEGHTVYFTNYDNPIQDQISLGEITYRLSKSKTREAVYFNKLIFPMVDFKHEERMDWVIGATAIPGYGPVTMVRIMEAQCEQHLRINDKGAHAKQFFAGYGASFLGAVEDNTYRLDGPQLLVWFEKSDKYGNQVVTYSTAITPEHMKDPGKL